MLNADKSGTVFTMQIEKNDTGKLVIESSWGFGESINKGIVTPDEYLIDKINGNVIPVYFSKGKEGIVLRYVARNDHVTGDSSTYPTKLPSLIR